MWTVVYCCLHLLKVACEIDLDLALFLFDLLYVQFFSLLMDTIQDKVGIVNCATLCILSIPFVFFILEFSLIFFITSVSMISPINIGVMFPFVFFSVLYQSFSLRFWNIPCEIIYLVLFLFDLLCWIYFCCLRLWNVPCEILGLVLFVFHLLSAKTFSCLQ